MNSSKTTISIRFKNNQTGHNDIILKLTNPKIERKLDSFYFILDNQPESIEGAKNSLIQLLKYWIRIIENIKKESIQFLPIDFSDEYLGVLKVEDEHDLIKFEYGYTMGISGYNISPSNSKDINNQKIEFKPDSKNLNFKMRKNDFISDIELSIDTLTKE